MSEQKLPLLQQLLTSAKGKVEYGLHVAWPPDEDGTVAEDWMPCLSKESQDYRYNYCTGKGLTCTRLFRIQSTTDWSSDAEVDRS